MALAYLTINLDDFTGDDHPPISQYSTITLDPGADHIDAAADVIHVRTIVVSLDQQGKAATANGVPCVDGKVPVVAGVMYAVLAPNVLRDGPHYIPALTAGQVVDLSDYITPGAPLTPDQAAILTARIKALETTPPDHGALTGLGDDDHTHYLTQGRGDARYIRTINGLPADIAGDITVAGGSGSPTVTGGLPRALAFAAVALASCDTTAAKFMFCGDSLTATNRWPTQFVKRLTHSHLPGVTPLVPVVTTTPGSVTVPSTGIYGVTTAISGNTSANYLANNNAVAVATTLQPHVIFHCIGTNDYSANVAPATFKTNVVAAINAIDAVLTKPAVHVLHLFSSAVLSGRTYTIDQYMTALIEIAEASPGTRVAVDLGPLADTLGIIGTDPYALDNGDGLHTNAAGDRVWGDLMARVVADAPVTGVLGWSATAPVADTTAPTWAATLTTGTPTSSTVPVTASALATDNVAVAGYEASTNSGGSWAAITPSGSVFAITGLAPSTAYPAPQLRAFDAAGNYSAALTAQSFSTAASGDVTPPTAGGRAATSVTDAGFVMTVTGAADETALAAAPYAFTTDGSTWSAYQASAVYVASGLTASTEYTTNHRVKDAAGNVTTGTAATVTTAASDVTAPTVGTLAGSAITSTGFTLTVSGAADETALHATPYRFSTDNGATYSAYQSSATYAVTGLAASTGYTCKHQTRDAAGNVATGAAVTVTTGTPLAALTDSFNRANSATLGTADTGQTWVLIGGSGPGIWSNLATRNPNSGTAVINFGQADMRVEADMVAGAWNYSPTIIARSNSTYTDAYLLMRQTSNIFNVVRRVGGVYAEPLGSMTYALGDRVGISVHESGGSSIVKTWKNGVEQASYSDSTVGRPTGTYGGLDITSNSVTIDNFSINPSP